MPLDQYFTADYVHKKHRNHEFDAQVEAFFNRDERIFTHELDALWEKAKRRDGTLTKLEQMILNKNRFRSKIWHKKIKIGARSFATRKNNRQPKIIFGGFNTTKG